MKNRMNWVGGGSSGWMGRTGRSMIDGNQHDEKEMALDTCARHVDHPTTESVRARSRASCASELPPGGEPSPVRAADVRVWAARQGIWLAARGKVPVLVTNQYRAAVALSESMGPSGEEFLSS